MTTVGYARVSSTGQDLGVQLEKLEAMGCEKIFQEKRSGVDAGRPELKRCLERHCSGRNLLSSLEGLVTPLLQRRKSVAH
jgi:DNA invertase Pin-like site-specific DNA recombinase